MHPVNEGCVRAVCGSARPRDPKRSNDNRVIHIPAGQRHFSGCGQHRWWRVGLYAGFCSGPCGPLAAIHLGRRLPDGSSGLPGVERAGHPPPAWPCSGWGLPSHPGHPGCWCALTAPFHPYLCDRSCDPSPSAVCSLLHFPAGHPDWALPSILPCGVRTFLGRITTLASGSVRGHPADSPPGPFNPRTRYLSKRMCRASTSSAICSSVRLEASAIVRRRSRASLSSQPSCTATMPVAWCTWSLSCQAVGPVVSMVRPYTPVSNRPRMR
jgi:hypothetical protein